MALTFHFAVLGILEWESRENGPRNQNRENIGHFAYFNSSAESTQQCGSIQHIVLIHCQPFGFVVWNLDLYVTVTVRVRPGSFVCPGSEIGLVTAVTLNMVSSEL